MAVVLVGFVAVNVLFLVAMFGSPLQAREVARTGEGWPRMRFVALAELAFVPDGELVRVRGRVLAQRGLADKPGVVALRGQLEDWVTERVVPFSLALDDEHAVAVDVRRARLLPAASGKRNWRLSSDDEVDLVAVKTTVRDGLDAPPDLPGGPFRTVPVQNAASRVVLGAVEGAPVLLRPA